jgi:hypothetical protein
MGERAAAGSLRHAGDTPCARAWQAAGAGVPVRGWGTLSGPGWGLGERRRTVQLAVGGYDLTFRNGLLDDLGISASQSPAVRGWWTVTTTDYDPMLLVEIDPGLLIVSAPVGEEATPGTLVGLRWDAVRGLGQDEHSWMLVITTANRGEMRFLFSSLGELHSVATRLAARCAEFAGVVPRQGLGVDGTGGSGERPGACGRPPRRPASARGRSRSVAAPHEPTLDRIEARLATMEMLLAGLTSGPAARKH